MTPTRTQALALALVVCLALVPGAHAVALTDATVQITAVVPDRTPDERAAVVPADEPIVVAGITNLQPDENLIVVEVVTVTGDLVAVADTDAWGRDGEWSVALPGLAPGEYLVTADGATASDTVALTAAAATPTPTEADTPTPTASPAQSPAPTADATPSSTPTLSPTRTPTASPAQSPAPTGPGSGVSVALALVLSGVLAAAALAARRR